MAQLHAVLPQLLSADAATRQAGEATLQAFQAQPQMFLSSLANAAGTLEQPEVDKQLRICF
jgi:hypothetical protein